MAVRPLGAAEAVAAQAGAAAKGPVWLRGLKFLAALVLLPACVGLPQGLWSHFLHTGAKLRVQLLGWPQEMVWFGYGILAFGALAFFWRPVVVYLFGHELVHALATWICLGKVSNLRVSASGGQVTTSKSNTFIRLAPYFLPLYVLLAAGVYLGLDRFWRPLAEYRWCLCVALGFGMAFHLAFTVWCLRLDQPDLKPDGWFFSLVLIYLANLLVLALVLGLVLSGTAGGAWTHFQESAKLGIERSHGIYLELLRQVEGMTRS
ncbi:MAG: hypothetical protein M5U26_26030 [Planctomycetota bacterium]|nr:hypothetical protein [Planctomycetota bacterium]